MKEENQTIIKAINMFGRVPEQYELLEEIERLNNIINELEKGIKENIEELEEHQLSRDRIYEGKEILRFLQELKGEDKK